PAGPVRPSRRSPPAATPARPSTAAAASHPFERVPHFPSPASADTISQRWQRSPQTAPPSPGMNDPPLPNQPHDPANPSNRVLPSMLAPNPSQHLESENPPPGNPLQRFSLPGSCSKALLRRAVAMSGAKIAHT